MPKTPLHDRGLATRHELLAAAQAVFGRRGYEAATVDEIAKTAGKSKGAFYFHFPTKDDIFMELCRSAVIPDWTAFSSRDTGDEVEAEEQWHLLLEFWAHAARNGKIRDALGQLYRERLDGVRASFAGERFNEANLTALAHALIALQDGLLVQDVVGVSEGRRVYQSLVQQMLQVFVLALEQDGAESLANRRSADSTSTSLSE